MKSIVEYINDGIFNDKESLTEGIFDDNIKSSITLHGIEVYEPDWKLAKDYYQKRRKWYFGDKNKVYLGDMSTLYNVIYNENDCVIAVEEGGEDIYVLSPETIYINHEVSEGVQGRHYTFSLIDVDDANDFSICFDYWKMRGEWAALEGCFNDYEQRKAKKLFGFYQGYVPETISNKAKSIIENWIKS